MHTNTAIFVKTSRKALRLTQFQLSLIINKKRSNIALYETGRTIPPGDVVLKLIELCHPSFYGDLCKDKCLSYKLPDLINNPDASKNQSICQKKSAA
ncbi:MAG: helix-turn-helix transcriptional regulator [Desulfobacterales bacterium]|nr:helix-turn-helix transcriptional regulator [Desulfobacterales bacterium]